VGWRTAWLAGTDPSVGAWPGGGFWQGPAPAGGAWPGSTLGALPRAAVGGGPWPGAPAGGVATQAAMKKPVCALRFLVRIQVCRPLFVAVVAGIGRIFMHKLPQLLGQIGGQLKILEVFARRLAAHHRLVVPLLGDEVGQVAVHRGRQFLLPMDLTPLISLIQGIHLHRVVVVVFLLYRSFMHV